MKKDFAMFTWNSDMKLYDKDSWIQWRQTDFLASISSEWTPNRNCGASNLEAWIFSIVYILIVYSFIEWLIRLFPLCWMLWDENYCDYSSVCLSKLMIQAMMIDKTIGRMAQVTLEPIDAVKKHFAQCPVSMNLFEFLNI